MTLTTDCVNADTASKHGRYSPTSDQSWSTVRKQLFSSALRGSSGESQPAALSARGGCIVMDGDAVSGSRLDANRAAAFPVGQGLGLRAVWGKRIETRLDGRTGH